MSTDYLFRLILPPTFSTKLNERSIQPQSNKKAYNEETSAFYLDKWHVLLDGDELTVKLKDTGETTDTPNSFGMVKLQFPMTVTLEGTPVKIKIKDSDDNFTVYHNVVIKAEKDPNVSSKTEDKKSEIGTLRMALESGNIMIESSPDTKTNQVAYIKQEVVIEIDFDSKVPSILVYPYIKYLVSVDENK
ncbi:hypothetical protein HCN44_006491 [Aphidius gifuensis]|uniref:Uncharacterized protein n=1 Tax=Aphidius gifuensis TaxID=684658 RepID=A0A835CSV1_APHGI|nr:hypothetical protein HCN44_006491 [Aphidius gifuensis]